MPENNGRYTTAQALGTLCAEVKGLRSDIDDLKHSMEELSKSHTDTRELVNAHRTGVKIFVWAGGVAIALLAFFKGVDWLGK